jgi:hypothetical protein
MSPCNPTPLAIGNDNGDGAAPLQGLGQNGPAATLSPQCDVMIMAGAAD